MAKKTMGIHHITAIVGHLKRTQIFTQECLGFVWSSKLSILMTQVRIIFILGMKAGSREQSLPSFRGPEPAKASLETVKLA